MVISVGSCLRECGSVLDLVGVVSPVFIIDSDFSEPSLGLKFHAASPIFGNGIVQLQRRHRATRRPPPSLLSVQRKARHLSRWQECSKVSVTVSVNWVFSRSAAFGLS